MSQNCWIHDLPSGCILTQPLGMHYSVHQTTDQYSFPYSSQKSPNLRLFAYPLPFGPGHVDCQWSKNGSPLHNKHFQNRGWKLTPAFCQASIAFLALDPWFQIHTYSGDWDGVCLLLLFINMDWTWLFWIHAHGNQSMIFINFRRQSVRTRKFTEHDVGILHQDHIISLGRFEWKLWVGVALRVLY